MGYASCWGSSGHNTEKRTAHNSGAMSGKRPGKLWYQGSNCLNYLTFQGKVKRERCVNSKIKDCVSIYPINLFDLKYTKYLEPIKLCFDGRIL